MKNLLLLLGLFFSIPLLSQESKDIPLAEPKQKFSLGVLAGLNINHMPYRPNPEGIRGSGTYASNLKPELAFFAGVSARQPMTKRLAFKVDGQLAVRGYGLKKPTPLERYQAYYLDFVPQLEYKIFKNLYFSMGGYCGVQIEEHLKFQDQNWAVLDDNFISFAENTDWGLASALSVEFDRVSFLVKYQHGLTPGIKWDLTDDTGVSRSSGQFHRTLQVGLVSRLFKHLKSIPAAFTATGIIL